MGLDVAGAKAAGYSDADIAQWLASNPDHADPTTLRHLTGLAGTALQEGTEGTAGAVSLPRQLLEKLSPGSGEQSFLPSLKSPLSLLPPPFNVLGMAPTGQQIAQGAENLGLQGHTQPQGPAETYGAAALRGVPAAVPALLSGGTAIPALFAGMGGSMAGEAAHQALPESTVAPLLAGLAGGFGAQGLSNVLAGITTKGLARTIGSSQTLQEAGTALQEGARGWLGALPKRLEETWAPVDAAIPPTQATPIGEFAVTLASMRRKAGQLQPLVDEISSKLPEKLQNLLENKTLSGVAGVPPNWSDVTQLRSAFGEAMSNPQVVKDIPAQQISSLYKALTSDMQATAKSAGALDEFNAANAESSRLYGLAEGTMGKLVRSAKPTAEDPVPEQVASQLLARGKKGGTDLTSLRAELNDELNELASAHLHTNPSGWGKLAPEAQEALVPDTATRAKLDKLTPQVGEMTKERHTSEAILSAIFGTGLAKVLGVPDGVGEVVGAVAPSIARGVKHVVQNPGELNYAGAGALGGSGANPLMGTGEGK